MITKSWFVIIRTNEDGTLSFLSSEGWCSNIIPECLYEDADGAYMDAANFGGKVNMVTLTLRPITE